MTETALVPTFADKLTGYDLVRTLRLSHYGDYTEEHLEVKGVRNARYLSSRSGPGRHRVLLDVDNPVTLTHPDGTPTLTFHRPVFGCQARWALAALANAGLVDHDVAHTIGKALWAWLRYPLTVPLLVEPEVVTSKTPGHFHLYFDHVVTKGELITLLSVLGAAGVIDRRWARVSRGYGSALLSNPNRIAKKEDSRV